MAVRTLNIDIMSYLKGKGFEAVDSQIAKVKSSLNSLKSVVGSPLVKMATGFFAVNSLIGQYNKAIEASNFQLEQETKLYSTLKGQGFRDEQIQSIKDYASELQKVGVVGDEVTLAGAQQLATYNLTEDSLKKLLPAMQDIIVQQKGLKGTGQDAVGAANMLAKGLLGQTGILQKAGITLTEYQEKLIKTGTQEEKVAALVEAVRMNVGEQNKEFLKTPEGRIVSAQNRIGDVYEYIGGLFRNVRADFWTFIADNDTLIQNTIGGILKVGIGMFDTFLKTFQSIWNVFTGMPGEVKDTIKMLIAFFGITQFPIAGIVLIIEDIFAAFQGKESYTEEAINAILQFLNYDYNFDDLRNDIKAFWHDLSSDAEDANKEISFLTATLEELYEVLKATMSIGKILLGVQKAPADIVKFIGNSVLDYKNIGDHWDELLDGRASKLITSGYDGLVNFTNNTSDIGDRYTAHQRKQETLNIEEEKNKYKKKYGETPEETFNKIQNSMNLQNEQFKMPVQMQKNNENIKYNDFSFSRSDILAKNPEGKTLNKKEEKVFKEKSITEVKYSNNAKYEININATGLDAREVANVVDKKLKAKETEDIEKMRTQLGMKMRLAE